MKGVAVILKIDLFTLRKELNLSQKEMAKQLGICRVKYVDAESMNWLEDRYVYEQARKGVNVIRLPKDFFAYTSFSLLLNILAHSIMMEGLGSSVKKNRIHTQEDVANILGITQPYVSMLLKSFSSIYDRKASLIKIYDPYLQPFYPIGDGLYKRYVNDSYQEPDAPIAKGREDIYSVLAVLYNFRMKKKNQRTVAEEMGISLKDLQYAIRTNTLSEYADLLEKFFSPFLVPFYQEGNTFHMIGSEDNLDNILLEMEKL